ncbi:MAG: hypothetical protein FWC41_02520 [Firmicutes bacterium]|nr:hypothetical protein [Bacillota bacterium]
MKEKKDIVMGGRVTKHMKAEMDKLGANVYDAVKFFLDSKDNSEIKTLIEIKELLEQNNNMANQIIRNNEKLEDLKVTIKFNGTNEDLYEYLFNKDIANALEKTLDYFNTWNTKNYHIEQFIDLKNEYIQNQAKKCSLDIEEFQGKLLEKYYGFTQATL